MLAWAEQFGLGELALMPEQFWSLTLREFWIKHDAFHRDQDRQLWITAWHVWRTTTFKKPVPSPDNVVGRMLLRYPLKPWLMDD